MSLIIHSQYTKPEGTIKFDDLVVNAKHKEIKFLALTDHGNFSGISEFYSKCLDFGIKPIIGIDFFCQLENEKCFRIKLYVRNYSGYKSILNLVSRFRFQGRACCCSADDLGIISDCYFCVCMYKYDHLSECLEQENDPVHIHKRLTAAGINESDIFFNVFTGTEVNYKEISSQLLELNSKGDIRLVGSNPAYYLDQGGHKYKELASRISGVKQTFNYRFQYLENIANLKEEIGNEASDNAVKIAQSCHFILEEVPVKFPDLRIETKIEYSYFETLKTEILGMLKEQKEELNDVVMEELAYIRKHNIASLLLFMIEAKKEFFRKYSQDLFFAGFVNDLHISYLLDLTLSTPIFASADYHRAVLANKKIHPQITVVVSPQNRQNLFEYMSEKFPNDRICFLSDFTRWHFSSIMSALSAEYGISKDIVDIMYPYYKQNYSPAGQFEYALEQADVKELLKKYPEQEEILVSAKILDDVFRNYNTNTNQIVISSENVRSILPLISENEDSAIGVSFFNISTARYFGVWNINVESNSYLDIRRYFKMAPIRETILNNQSKSLISRIMSDDLTMIPYFSSNQSRYKYLELSKNNFCNLILYLESGRYNLSYLFNRKPPEYSGNRFKKELEITRGFIVFREQFFFVCDKLFSSKDFYSLKRRLLESTGMIQMNSILDQLAEKKNCSDKCDYLRTAVQPTVFNLSLSDTSVRVLIALRTLELRTGSTDMFNEFVFLRDVRNGGDWRKYIKYLKDAGYYFVKISVCNLTRNANVENKRIFLPPFCIRGISERISDYICGFIETAMPDSFQDVLERSDKEIIKHNVIEILIKVGFFDVFGSNRRELMDMNSQYFKSFRKDDSAQQELFEMSSVEMSVNTSEDFTSAEKMNFEEEFIGLSFTTPEGVMCELCGHIKPGSESGWDMSENVYDEHEFILYASLDSSDSDIIDGLAGFFSAKGNCTVKLYFSDTKKTVLMDGKIDINDLNFYKLKLKFNKIPFFIEIK